MKYPEAILVAVMAVSLAGCKLMAKKPAAPAAPPVAASAPQPLSVPQTNIELPREQPVDPEALITAQPITEPPPVTPPAAPPTVTPPRSGTRGGTKGGGTPGTPPPRPEPPAVETPRQQIQEMLPPEEQQRLQRAADAAVLQAVQIVTPMRPRGKHTARQGEVITRIDLYIKAYEEAKKVGDMRAAEDNALRALSTAKDLQSGK